MKYIISEDISWRLVADEVVMLNLATSSYHSLEEVGALIWARIDAGDSEERIVESIVHEYEIDPATATADVREFLDDLLSRGAILQHP